MPTVAHQDGLADARWTSPQALRTRRRYKPETNPCHLLQHPASATTGPDAYLDFEIDWCAFEAPAAAFHTEDGGCRCGGNAKTISPAVTSPQVASLIGDR